MTELKDFDQIEEGLYYLDAESKRIQAAKIFEIRRRFLTESLRKKEINEVKDLVDEYENLYRENKEINAFLLVSRQPKHVIEKLLEKQNER